MESSTRWKRSTGVGLLIVFVYAAFLVVLQKLSGVDYDAVADTASNLLRFVTLPVAAGSVFLALIWWRSGWGRSVFFDPPALRGSAIFWLPVAIVVAQIGLGLTEVSWGALSTKFVIVGIVGTLCVGFTEELLTRGLLLDAVRQSGSEIQALVVSSITFGLLHGLNIVNGQGFGLTLQQVILSAIAGVSFYAARRASGSLLLAMILHGVFDFQLLMQGITHRANESLSSVAIASAALLYLEVIVAIVIVVKVARDSRRGTA